jgi:aminomethyltransferase
MGEFFLKGPKALDLIQKVSSNDASKLLDGKAQYSCLPNETGGIVDDLLVYRMSEEEYMLVVNAANIKKDWTWISQHNAEGVAMENASDRISLFAVQGPKATAVVQKLTDVDLGAMAYYTFQKNTVAGIPDVIISATGYTGAGGFELYVDNQHAVHLWKNLFEAGSEYNIKPIGLGARDTLRLEMGLCLYGNDIDDTTSPLEAGLGWITKFNKAFINAENLQKQKEQGVSRKLVGLVMQERGIPRAGYEIYDTQGEPIGKVTSGAQSPMLEKGIGLGYVKIDHSQPGTHVLIGIRNRRLTAEVVKPPMIKM